MQEAVLPLDDKKAPRTLGNVLIELIPQLFFDDKVPKVTIQGTSPSLNTPIMWLSQNYSYPDNFLYIVYSEA